MFEYPEDKQGTAVEVISEDLGKDNLKDRQGGHMKANTCLLRIEKLDNNDTAREFRGLGVGLERLVEALRSGEGQLVRVAIREYEYP